MGMKPEVGPLVIAIVNDHVSYPGYIWPGLEEARNAPLPEGDDFANDVSTSHGELLQLVLSPRVTAVSLLTLF